VPSYVRLCNRQRSNIVADWAKNPDKPPIFENPAGRPDRGPKKKTCPGKPGRMVTLCIYYGDTRLGKHASRFVNSGMLTVQTLTEWRIGLYTLCETYDTIRCGILTCARKLTGSQFNPANGTKYEKYKKLKIKTKYSSEETVRVIVREGSGGRSKTTGRRISKKVGFKSKVKERRSYG